jgi:hypothetical protein
MFLEKYKNEDPNKMPPCFELKKTSGKHPLSPLEVVEAAMPWEDRHQQPKLRYISVGKELEAIMDTVTDKASPHIHFLIPSAQNWPGWDAALVLHRKEGKKRVVHVIFLQTTLAPDHVIYAKGLNRVRDACPGGLEVHYHYVLVLLTQDKAAMQIPKWRDVSVSSKEPKKKDKSWHPRNLREYVMFVHMKELCKSPSQQRRTWY